MFVRPIRRRRWGGKGVSWSHNAEPQTIIGPCCHENLSPSCSEAEEQDAKVSMVSIENMYDTCLGKCLFCLSRQS